MSEGGCLGAIIDAFLSQIFSSSVLILTVSPGFKVDRRFWVFGSFAVLVVEDLIEGGLIKG